MDGGSSVCWPAGIRTESQAPAGTRPVDQWPIVSAVSGRNGQTSAAMVMVIAVQTRHAAAA